MKYFYNKANNVFAIQLPTAWWINVVGYKPWHLHSQLITPETVPNRDYWTVIRALYLKLRNEYPTPGEIIPKVSQ